MLKFGVSLPNFTFLLDLFGLELLVLVDNVFVLPGSPYFILDLFFLLRCLFNSSYDASLSSGYLN